MIEAITAGVAIALIAKYHPKPFKYLYEKFENHKEKKYCVKLQSLRRWSWLVKDKKGKNVREYNKKNHSPAFRKAIGYSKKLNKQVN